MRNIYIYTRNIEKRVRTDKTCIYCSIIKEYVKREQKGKNTYLRLRDNKIIITWLDLLSNGLVKGRVSTVQETEHELL